MDKQLEEFSFKQFNLTECQKKAFTHLKNFFNGKEHNMCLLDGFAGTGKTYLIKKFVKWLIDEHNLPVALCATTNKAVKILRKDSDLDNVEFCTIHSLLGLCENIKDDGSIEFIKDDKKKAKISKYKFVIIDESSMLDRKLFIKLLEYDRIKFLFIGDNLQIPPVNEDDKTAIPFNKDKRKQHNIDYISLLEIVRQNKDNPIINATICIRKNILIDNKLSDLIKTNITKEKGGVLVIDTDEGDSEESIDSIIKKLFCNDYFKEDADHAKIVAWRKMKMAERMTRVIRTTRIIKELQRN